MSFEFHEIRLPSHIRLEVNPQMDQYLKYLMTIPHYEFSIDEVVIGLIYQLARMQDPGPHLPYQPITHPNRPGQPVIEEQRLLRRMFMALCDMGLLPESIERYQYENYRNGVLTLQRIPLSH